MKECRCSSRFTIGVSGSFLRGDQQLHPAFILSCQTVLLMDKLEDRWLKNRQKWEKYRKVWQKPTKSGRRQTKMTEKLSKCGVLLIIFCQASHFCPAKLPFLSCQAPISVLPSSLFCPAKLINFSRGGPRPPRPPPQIRL